MEGDKNFKFQFHFIEIKGFRLIGKFLFSVERKFQGVVLRKIQLKYFIGKL